MAMGLGYMLAGGLLGSAKAVDEIADGQIRNRDRAALFLEEARLKNALSDQMAARDASAYIGATDRVKSGMRADGANRLQANLPAGAADALPGGALEDMGGGEQAFDPASSSTRLAIREQLRGGGQASGGLLLQADKDYQVALSDEKAARAEAFKERKLDSDAKAAVAREDRRDARESARQEHQSEMLDKRLEAMSNRRDMDSSVREMVGVLKEERVANDSRRRDLRKAMESELDGAYSKTAKEAVAQKYQPKLDELDARDKLIDDRVGSIWGRINNGRTDTVEPTEKPPKPTTSNQRTSTKIVDTLPTTGVKVGQRARDTKTGKIITFNGKTWE